MASGLPKLQILEIRESSQLLGVFGQDDHALPVNVEKEMVFPNVARHQKSARRRLAIFSVMFDLNLIGSLESPPSNLLKATRKPDVLVLSEIRE